MRHEADSQSQMPDRLRIGSVVFDCRNFDVMVKFWQEALHYVPRDLRAPGWVVLRDPSGKGPNVSINRDEDYVPLRNHLHLDLYTEDQEAEVDRLLKLGASLRRAPPSDEDFVVLADPEGNLICVVDITHP